MVPLPRALALALPPGVFDRGFLPDQCADSESDPELGNASYCCQGMVLHVGLALLRCLVGKTGMTGGEGAGVRCNGDTK